MLRRVQSPRLRLRQGFWFWGVDRLASCGLRRQGETRIVARVVTGLMNRS